MSGQGVSLQSQILDHFLDSMRDVRETLSGKEEKDQKKRLDSFRLQILYLRKLVPDRDIQNKIKNAIDTAKKSYMRDSTFSSEDLADYASQMETLTEVMIYLNEGMDLIHNDLTGAMTERAMRHAKEPVKVAIRSDSKNTEQEVKAGDVAGQ